MARIPIILAAIGLFAAAPALAQEVGRPPARPIGGPPLALAMEAAEAAVASCKAQGWPVIATVVDEIGLTKLALAPDGAPGPGSNGGRRKAVMAVTFGQNSSEVVARMKTDTALADRIKADTVNFFPSAGAVLIKSHGRIIGALGVGGAPGGEKDEACAGVGVAKIENRLP